MCVVSSKMEVVSDHEELGVPGVITPPLIVASVINQPQHVTGIWQCLIAKYVISFF